MVRARKRFVHHGPNLHMAIVTLRCNETCVYCHASRADMDAVHTDMTRETAERTVDFIFKTTSPFVTIEFQGGEPLVNFPVVQHLIEYALDKNRSAGKQLEFTMVSNLALMDDAKLEYLLGKRVQLCTSIDGPAPLHDKQRVLPMASSFDHASRWIKRVNDAYAAAGLDPTLYHVEALLTTTRATLPLWKEVVDTYVALGCRALFLRPVDPFGFAAKTGPKIEYPRREYLEFYRRAVDYMIGLNAGGVEILERYAAIFLTKIVGGRRPQLPRRALAGRRRAGRAGLQLRRRDLHLRRGPHARRHGRRRVPGRRRRGPRATATWSATRPCARWPWRRTSTRRPTASTAPTSRTAACRRATATRPRARSSDGCARASCARSTRASRTTCSPSWPTATADERRVLERWTTHRPREHFVQGSPGAKPVAPAP
jgi:hypothetical protein